MSYNENCCGLLAEPGCQGPLCHVTTYISLTTGQRSRREKQQNSNNWLLKFSIGGKHQETLVTTNRCNHCPPWAALAQVLLGQHPSFPKYLPVLVSQLGPGLALPVPRPLKEDMGAGLWRYMFPLMGPYGSAMQKGGRESLLGPGRKSLTIPEGLPSATHQVGAGASAESVWCIGCHLRRFIPHYFYRIQLFLEAILIQHADYMHTRFSLKNKTHNESAM